MKLFNNNLYLNSFSELFIIKNVNDGDDIELLEYEIDQKFDKFTLLDGEIVFKRGKQYTMFDQKSEKETPILDLDDNILIDIDQNFLYKAKFENGVIYIDKYNSKDLKNIEISYKFEQKSVIKTKIDTQYTIFSDLWDGEEFETKENPKGVGFKVVENSFLYVNENGVIFGNFEKQGYKYCDFKELRGMDLDINIFKNQAVINGKDEQFSIDIVFPHLPFKRDKRRGGDEVIPIRVIKRGKDLVTPIVSKDGKYWLGSDGEEQIFPIVYNIKKGEPVAVLDMEIDNSTQFTATDSFENIFIYNNNIITKYEWNIDGIVKDFELNLELNE